MVKPDDEPLIREAARKISEGIRLYERNYAFRDYQDLLAMVALQYTIDSMRKEKELSYRNHELSDRLQQIDRMLSI